MLLTALVIPPYTIAERAAASLAPKDGHAPLSFNLTRLPPSASLSMTQSTTSAETPGAPATLSRSASFQCWNSGGDGNPEIVLASASFRPGAMLGITLGSPTGPEQKGALHPTSGAGMLPMRSVKPPPCGARSPPESARRRSSPLGSPPEREPFPHTPCASASTTWGPSVLNKEGDSIGEPSRKRAPSTFGSRQALHQTSSMTTIGLWQASPGTAVDRAA